MWLTRRYVIDMIDTSRTRGQGMRGVEYQHCLYDRELNNMSGRGRVLDALNLEEPDRVPSFDFVYEPKSFENILEIDVPEITPSVCVRGH